MIVQTEGAIYVLDTLGGFLTRYPREVVRASDFSVSALRKDTEPIPYSLGRELKVGEPAVFLLQIRNDGVQTVRTTTNVLDISGV